MMGASNTSFNDAPAAGTAPGVSSAVFDSVDRAPQEGLAPEEAGGGNSSASGEEPLELMRDLEGSEKSVKRYQRFIIRLIAAIAIIWVLFFQVVGLTHMPSGDMYPRMDAGDLVLFYRLDTDVRAQDVIVIEKETPDSNGEKQQFISRVIAKEGDTVDFKDGRVVVNDNMLIEDGIFYPTPTIEGLGEYPLVLGPGECFVLGDKREEATDSRLFGVVKRDEIRGTVITIARRNNL